MGVGGPDCFPYLFINVLFSLREAVCPTGSYTLLLDDFLLCVNIFQLRCDFFRVQNVFHKQPQTRTTLDVIAQTGRNDGRMSIISLHIVCEFSLHILDV